MRIIAGDIGGTKTLLQLVEIDGATQTVIAEKRFASGGVYLNFIGDEGGDRVRAAFGNSYERLAAVKRTYDPENFFRRNQNIAPALVG